MKVKIKTIIAEFTIDQKLQQLKQLTEEMEVLTKELAEASAFEIPEGELDQVSGGYLLLHLGPANQSRNPAVANLMTF